MRALLSIPFFLLTPFLAADDIFKIEETGRLVVPFKASWKVDNIHLPGSKNENRITSRVEAQYFARDRFLVKKTHPGGMDRFEAKDSVVDNLLEEFLPALALRTYLKWYERRIVGISAEDDSMLICESVSDVRFFGKMRIELERGEQLKVRKVMFYRYNSEGKEIPQKTMEFDYDDSPHPNKLGRLFPVKAKITSWENPGKIRKISEISLLVASDIDKKGEAVPGGDFLTP